VEKQGAAISKSPFGLVGGLETAVPLLREATNVSATAAKLIFPTADSSV